MMSKINAHHHIRETGRQSLLVVKLTQCNGAHLDLCTIVILLPDVAKDADEYPESLEFSLELRVLVSEIGRRLRAGERWPQVFERFRGRVFV